jgi:hypothetical protein
MFSLRFHTVSEATGVTEKQEAQGKQQTGNGSLQNSWTRLFPLFMMKMRLKQSAISNQQPVTPPHSPNNLGVPTLKSQFPISLQKEHVC